MERFLFVGLAVTPESHDKNTEDVNRFLKDFEKKTMFYFCKNMKKKIVKVEVYVMVLTGITYKCLKFVQMYLKILYLRRVVQVF